MAGAKRMATVLRWALAMCAGATAADLDVGIELSDTIGHTWSDELVSIETGTLPPGTVRPDELGVQDGSGKALPAQCEGPVLHGDGSLCRARVWTVVTLPANRTVRLALTRQTSPPLDRPARATRDDRGIVLDDGTGRIAVRLPAAVTLDSPRPLRELPAPIAAVRLYDGRWIGRGRLVGDVPIRAMSTEITARGPLFAAARVTYLGEGDVHYRCDVRVTRGEPLAVIEEEFNLPAAQEGPESVDFTDPSDEGRIPTFDFVLSGAFAPDAARYKAFSASDRTQTIHRTRDPATLHGFGEDAYDLALKEAGRTFSLTGYMAWHANIGEYWMAYETAAGADAGMLALIGMRPQRWFNPACIQIWTDPTLGVYASAPLGISHRRSWEVDSLHDPELDTPIHSGILDPDLPRDLGRRCWALCTVPKSQGATDDYSFDSSPIQKLVNRHSKFPLEKARHWILDWDSRGVSYPRMFGPGDAAGGAARSEEDVRQAIEDDRRWVLDTVEGRGRFGQTTFHLGLAQTLFGVMERMDTTLGRADCTQEEARALKARAAFTTYLICDEQFMPRRSGFHMGNPNMPLAAEAYVGLAACMMPRHPRSSDWANRAVTKLSLLFARYVDPVSGAWEECPHYMVDASFRQAFSAFVALRHSGYADLWQLPSVKRTLRYAMGIMSPPDPRFGIRILGTQGNTATEGLSLFSWAAAAYRHTDPDLSAECQWMWDADGRQYWYAGSRTVTIPELPMAPPELGSRHYRGFGAVLRNGFPDADETWMCYRQGMQVSHYEDGDQGSWHLYAKGAPLSLDFGSQYGPMMWRPWLHNRISVDHKVDPMILSEHDVDEFLTTVGADFVSGCSVIEHLHRMTETPYEPPPADPDWGRDERIPPVTWRRSVLFVKDVDLLGPNYFVVADTFDGATTPTDWSCWCLAEACQFDGNIARFRGQYGVDLDVVCVRPAKAEWVQDRSPVPPSPTVCKLSYGPGVPGWPEANRAPEQAHAPVVSHNFTYLRKFWQRAQGDRVFEERQICARLRQPAGDGYLVVLYPRKHDGEEIPRYAPWAGERGVELTFADGHHYVIAAPAAVELKADGVKALAATAVVRDRAGQVELDLMRGTRLSYRGWSILGAGPVTLHQRGDSLGGETYGPSRSITIGLPGKLAAGRTLWLDGKPTEMLTKRPFVLAVNAGTHRFDIR